VVEVHPAELAPVVGPDRGTHGVDSALVGFRIGVGDAGTGKFDQLDFAGIELKGGRQQRSHRHSLSKSHGNVRGTTRSVRPIRGPSLLAGFGA